MIDKYMFITPEGQYIRGYVCFNSYGAIETHFWQFRGIGINNSACVISEKGSAIATGAYYSHTESKYSCTKGSSLYFAKGCRMSRALYRNSGYKTVLDVDKAVLVVVPDIKRKECLLADFVLKKEGNLFMAEWNDDNVIKTPENTQKFIDYFDAAGFEILFAKPCKCEFISNLDICREVITKEYPSRRYIVESRVPLDMPVEINEETFDMWRNCNDETILDKSVCASNWTEYPYSLSMFLKLFKNYTTESPSRSANFKLILQNIGYNRSTRNVEKFKISSAIVTQKDWNFWQDYCLHLYNLPPEGGFADPDNSQASLVLPFIRAKIALKPRRISCDMPVNMIFTQNP